MEQVKVQYQKGRKKKKKERKGQLAEQEITLYFMADPAEDQ